MRKWTRTAALLLCCMLLPGLASATEIGEGAWGQINQELVRPENWQRMVENSNFALGERTEVGITGGQPLYQVEYGTYPSIDGSTVSLPMAIEFARQHLPLSEADLVGFVFLSTTHAAYEHLIERKANGSPMIVSALASMDPAHPVDLVIATEPSDEELALAQEHGVTLVQKPVCYDAFVFITHADNPVDSLTVEQIQKIYKGEITNWNQVGGPDNAIRAFQREANSGSQTAMENLVMRGEPLSAAISNEIVGGMEGLVRRVGTYENDATSLGYTYRYYIDTLYKDEGIKMLRIDGVAPDDGNIRSGAYPFSTHYYGVIRGGEEQAAGGLFLDWMLSEEGQRCIRQAGYIPMME